MRHGPPVNEYAIERCNALWKIIDARATGCPRSPCRRRRRCTVHPLVYLTHPTVSLPPGACPLTTLDEYRTLKMGLYHMLLKLTYRDEDRAAREKEEAEAREAGASRPRGGSKAAPVSTSR